MNDQTNRTVQILKMYVKDCSVESPNAPAIFQAATGETSFKLDLDITNTKLDDGNYEVVLTLHTNASLDGRTLFLIETKHAALIQANGFPDDEMETLLEIWVPTQVYPYAREVITSLSAHAGFPPVVLPVINFEQYHETRKQVAAAQQPNAPATPSVQ